MVRIVIGVFSFATLCYGFSPGSASAYNDPPVKLALEPGYIESAESLLLENSPRRIPGVEPSVTSGKAYESFITPPPEASSAVQTDLESGEVPDLLADSSVWLWDWVPPLAVAGGSFWAGWEIGSAIYGIFFGESEPQVESVAFEATYWEPLPPGYLMFSDGSGNVFAPDWGLRGSTSSHQAVGSITDTGFCEYEIYGDGERLYAPGWLPSNGCGANSYRNYQLWKPEKPISCGPEAYRCPGIEPVPSPNPSKKRTSRLRRRPLN